MSKLSPDDARALEDVGPLLRFAAEHVKNLEPDLSLAIAEARTAVEQDQWTPQISQRFWGAFSRLCDLVQPVTMNCLVATDRNVEPSLWAKYRGGEKISIAERSSSRYLIAMFLLLALILPIQLYVWTCTNLSKKIDDFVAADRTKLTKLSEEFIKLDTATKDRKEDVKWTVDEMVRADKISAESSELYRTEVDRIIYESSILESISNFFIGTRSTLTINIPKRDADWFDHYRSAREIFGAAEVHVQKIQERASLVVGVFGAYILPILFGTIGAVAYVIRTISEQIRTSTFSTSSPIRHVMRVALGALAGVVVGLFNSLSSQLSLSPLAVAFLAGYGVEAVFSMFDGIVEKFKQTRP